MGMLNNLIIHFFARARILKNIMFDGLQTLEK